MALVALAIFLLQENLEHLTQHGHLPLLEPLLSGQYAAVLPVFFGLGLLLAAAGPGHRHHPAAVRARRGARHGSTIGLHHGASAAGAPCCTIVAGAAGW